MNVYAKPYWFILEPFVMQFVPTSSIKMCAENCFHRYVVMYLSPKIMSLLTYSFTFKVVAFLR